MSLALIALLTQATLPYLLTNCPVYTGAETSIGAMVANCPMLALHHDVAIDKKAPAPAKQSSDLTCPLCAVMSPLHGFVVAGLIALPPPSTATAASAFVIPSARIICLPQTASFSARAPPALG